MTSKTLKISKNFKKSLKISNTNGRVVLLHRKSTDHLNKEKKYKHYKQKIYFNTYLHPQCKCFFNKIIFKSY